MTKTDKLIQKILQGRSDSSIGFEELRLLLKSLGFEERIRGSHQSIAAHASTLLSLNDFAEMESS